jgi:hypothetical protein
VPIGCQPAVRYLPDLYDAVKPGRAPSRTLESRSIRVEARENAERLALIVPVTGGADVSDFRQFCTLVGAPARVLAALAAASSAIICNTGCSRIAASLSQPWNR